MKNCEEYGELISRLVDGDLTGQEDARLKAHLEYCEECRLVYTAFAGMGAVIAEDMAEPPESLCENVMAELRRGEVRKKNRRLRPVLTAAACVALAIIGAVGIGKGVSGIPVQTASFDSLEEAVAADEAAGESYHYIMIAPQNQPAPTIAPYAASEPAESEISAYAASSVPKAENETNAVTSEAGPSFTLSAAQEMEALREFLGNEPCEPYDGGELCTVRCEEDGSLIIVYGSGETAAYYDSSDDLWYYCSRSIEEITDYLTKFSIIAP